MNNIEEKKPIQNKLEKRHLSEEVFHDNKYSNENTSPKHYLYNPTYIIFQRMKKMVSDVRPKEKSILEYGCGNGWMTAELAALGAKIHSFDISEQAVEETKTFLEKKNLLASCEINKMAAEALQYDDDKFDIVFGFAILHHLDLELSIDELFRVMKPDGVAYFAEPLEGNPFLWVYRKLTPNYRTPDEKPIIIAELKSLMSKFSQFEHEEYYLTALFAFILIYIPYVSKYYDLVSRPLQKFDRWLLNLFPGLGRFAWYSVFTIRK